MQEDRSTWKLEFDQGHAKRAHDLNRQNYADNRRAAIETSNAVVRVMLLVNGGAVVALLALVSALASGQTVELIQIESLIAPVQRFAIGVGMTAVLAALAYLVNMLDADISNSVSLVWKHPYVVDKPIAKRLRSVRTVFHVMALLIGLAVIFVFFWGVWGVADAIRVISKSEVGQIEAILHSVIGAFRGFLPG